MLLCNDIILNKEITVLANKKFIFIFLNCIKFKFCFESKSDLQQ